MSLLISQEQNRHRNYSVSFREKQTISNYHSQLSNKGEATFARYPSDLAFEAQLQLHRKLSLKSPDSLVIGRAFREAASTRNRGRLQHLGDRKVTRTDSHRSQTKKSEANGNLVRAWNEVDKAMIRQRREKSSPFKIVKSLSMQTLKRKGEVEKLRREMLRRHQYNPFGSPAVESEFID